MNYSKILATAALALVSALVLVQAGQYSNNNQYNNNYGGAAQHHNQAIASHYPSGGCYGYQCNKRANPSPYGPYHAYAVRPVIYGGHGLYNYQGYARHHPAPAAHGARYARSYGAGPRRGPRPSYGGCHGPQCGRAPARHHAPARHYAPARPAHYGGAPQGYGMRPVKVVALAPSHGYNNNGYSNNNRGNGYNNNNAYNNHGNHRGASYGNAGHHSNQYNAPAHHNEQRHHRGGY